MTVREQVPEEALALPPEDRAFVVDQLERSLSTTGFASAEIVATWSEEIDRRVVAYERGELQAEDAEVVMRRMRQYLAERRTRQAKS